MRRRTWFLSISAIVVIAVLFAARPVLLPFVLALVIAYVFTPAVLWLERRRLPRWVAIVGIYSVTLGAVYGFIALTAPRMIQEGRSLAREVPRMLKQIDEEVIPKLEDKIRAVSGTNGNVNSSANGSPPPAPSVLPGTPEGDERKPTLRISERDDGTMDVAISSGFDVRPTDGGGYRIAPIEPKKHSSVARTAAAYAEKHYVDLVRGGVAFFRNVARSIFLFFMTLMLAAYLMLTHENIFGFFRGLVRPRARGDFDRLLTKIDLGLGGVVRGQLVICVVNGVLTAIGFALIGLKYWPVLAVVAAIGSLIPIFGSILSSVPAVAIGLTQSPMTAVLVLAWVVGIHQVEANFLNPKIIGTSAHLHPVLVVFSLLAGEHYFHVMGALLAVPVLSISQSLFLHFREVADRDEAGMLEPDHRRRL